MIFNLSDCWTQTCKIFSFKVHEILCRSKFHSLHINKYISYDKVVCVYVGRRQVNGFH